MPVSTSFVGDERRLELDVVVWGPRGLGDDGVLKLRGQRIRRASSCSTAVRRALAVKGEVRVALADMGT